MTNTTIFAKMIADYEELSYTNQYIFGFMDRGTVYMTYATAEVLPMVCCLDHSSRNGGCSLRFKPNKAQKEFLKQFELIPICSKEFFEAEVASAKYNKGEIFEKLVTEYNGQQWTKDHVPFTEAGDIEIDGIAYQIKYDRATFTNEATLHRLKTR